MQGRSSLATTVALPMPRLDRLRLLEQESPLARARTLKSLLRRMLAAVSSPR